MIIHDIGTLLHKELDDVTNCIDSFHEEQLRDSVLFPIMNYLSERVLPEKLNDLSFMIFGRS